MLVELQLLLMTGSALSPPVKPVMMTQPFADVGNVQVCAGPKFAPLIVKPTCGGPADSDSVAMLGVGGVIVTVALPVADVWAALVALTVTTCSAAIVGGAVKNPVDDMLHAPVGDTLQVTCWFVVPVTVAVNCWVCPWPSVTLTGLTVTPTEVTWNGCS